MRWLLLTALFVAAGTLTERVSFAEERLGIRSYRALESAVDYYATAAGFVRGCIGAEIHLADYDFPQVDETKLTPEERTLLDEVRRGVHLLRTAWNEDEALLAGLEFAESIGASYEQLERLESVYRHTAREIPELRETVDRLDRESSRTLEDVDESDSDEKMARRDQRIKVLQEFISFYRFCGKFETITNMILVVSRGLDGSFQAALQQEARAPKPTLEAAPVRPAIDRFPQSKPSPTTN